MRAAEAQEAMGTAESVGGRRDPGSGCTGWLTVAGVGPENPRRSVDQLGLEGLGVAEERQASLSFVRRELVVCEDPGETTPFLSW